VKISVNSCADKNVLLCHFCLSVRTCETSCFTYCIRWGIVSHDSIVDVDWLCATDLCHRYDTIGYGRCKNWNEVLPCAEPTAQAKNFESILTVKMETRRPVEGPLIWKWISGDISNCRYCTGRAQNLTRPALNNLLTLFHISSKSFYFLWSYSRTRENRFAP